MTTRHTDDVTEWRHYDFSTGLVDSAGAAEALERRSLEQFFSNVSNYKALLKVLGPKPYKQISCRLVDRFIRDSCGKNIIVPHPDDSLSAGQTCCLDSMFVMFREINGKKKWDIYCRDVKERFAPHHNLPAIITNPCQLNCWRSLIECGILDIILENKAVLKEESKKLRKQKAEKASVVQVKSILPAHVKKHVDTDQNPSKSVHVVFRSFIANAY